MFVDEEKFRNSITFLRMFDPRSFILGSETSSINHILSYKYKKKKKEKVLEIYFLLRLTTVNSLTRK